MADGSVKIDVTVDDSDAKKKLKGIEDAADDAAGGLEDLGDGAGEGGKGIDALGVAVGNLVADGLQNLISALGNAVQSLFALAEETREYREDMAKLDSAFTTAGHSTETANAAYTSFYKILGESDRSVEAVNHLAELTKNEEEVAKWSTICAGVTAKFGDSLPIEGLTEAANETAKVAKVTGPFADAINWASAESNVFSDALGGNGAALQAFNNAISQGLPVEDAFNAALAEMSTEQERSTAITSTLNGLYSEAAAEYNELTASTQAAREATSRMEQTQADMGAAIEPLTTAWTNLKAQGLEAIRPVVEALAGKFSELIGWLQENPAVLAMVTGALTALGVALGIVTAAVIAQTVAQWAQNAAWLASPITWIIIAIVAAVGALVGAFLWLWNNCEGFREFFIGMWDAIVAVVGPVWETIKGYFVAAWEAIKAAWDIVQPYFAQLWEGIKAVFAVVVDVLGAYFSVAWEYIKAVWDVVVAYFQLVWDGICAVFSVVVTFFSGMFSAAWAGIQAVWDIVTGYFEAIWETIKGIFAVVGAVLTGNWSDAWNGIKGIVGTWASYFSGVWNSIKSVFSAVASWFTSTFTAAINGIKNVWNGIKDFFSNIWSGIKNVFSKAKSEFSSIGSNIVAGIKQGISNAWGNLKSWFTGLFGDLKGVAKKILGIASPSKEFAWIGNMIVDGLEKGIDDKRSKALNAIGKLASDTIGVMQKNAQDVVDTIEGQLDAAEKAYKQEDKALKEQLEDRQKRYELADKELKKQRNKYNADSIDAQREKLKEEYDLDKEALDDQRELLRENYDINKEALQDQLDIAKEKEKNITSAANTLEKQLDNMLKIEENYVDDVTKVHRDLEKDIEAANKRYEDAFASRVESIKDGLSLFDKAEKGDAVNGSDLIRNLKSQNSVLTDYNKALDKLSEKGLNQAFVDELKGMGIDALPQIEAINKMSERQLTEYVALWEEKNRLATEAATDELSTMREETAAEIEGLKNDANVLLGELRDQYRSDLVALITEIGQSMTEAGDAGIVALGEQIGAYTKNGAALVDGIIKGVESLENKFVSAMVSSVMGALDAAKKAAGIHSPSKVMKEQVGENLGLGMIEGWKAKIADMKKAMSLDMSQITANLRATVTAENSRFATNTGTADTGFTDLVRAVGIQTAGINSLAGEYRRGTGTMRPIIIELDGRELGRATVDTGSTEAVRVGGRISLGGAKA